MQILAQHLNNKEIIHAILFATLLHQLLVGSRTKTPGPIANLQFDGYNMPPVLNRAAGTPH